jgi:phospholipase D1/2
VTSWASYKAFANHAEKFNKVPQDVAPPGSSGADHEPVKVVHDGPGTHGAGGGGSGGGVIGQEGVEGKPGLTRESDVVNGKPQDIPKSPAAGSTTSTSGKEDRKPSGQDEAWHDWEREQMEELLGELRGHLGMWFHLCV